MAQTCQVRDATLALRQRESSRHAGIAPACERTGSPYRTTITDIALAWALPTPAATLTPTLPLAADRAPVTMRALFAELELSYCVLFSD
jgi:hypothetical protein